MAEIANHSGGPRAHFRAGTLRLRFRFLLNSRVRGRRLLAEAFGQQFRLRGGRAVALRLRFQARGQLASPALLFVPGLLPATVGGLGSRLLLRGLCREFLLQVGQPALD